MVSKKSTAPKRGLDRQALQFSAGEVAQFYPQRVVADLEKYFDFLQLEKRVSLNTLISYRKCIYLVMGYLNSAHTRATDNLTFAGIAKQESGLLELGSLLGKRRKTSKKALDAQAVSQIAQDIALAEAEQNGANASHSGAGLNGDVAGSSGESETNAAPASKYKFSDWEGFTWEGVTPNQLQEVIQLAYLDGRSAASRNQLVAVIRSFWNWLLRTYELPSNPAATLGSIQIAKHYKAPVQATEIDRMIKQIEIEDFRDLRDHVMLQLMHATGLRVSELCNLKLQDLSLEKESISVVGKGKVFRKVPLTGTTKELIALYICMRELELWQKLTSSYRVSAATVETNTVGVPSKSSKNWYAGQELELLEVLGLEYEAEPYVDLTNAQAVQAFAEQVILRAERYSAQQGGRGERGVQHYQLDISQYLEQTSVSQASSLGSSAASSSASGSSESAELATQVAASEAEELGMLSLSALLGGGKKKAAKTKAPKTPVSAPELTVQENTVSETQSGNSSTANEAEGSTGQSFVPPTNYQLQKIELEKAGLKLIAHPLHALFISSHLKAITPRAVQYRLDQRASEAGILRNLSPHKLRHSFATRFFQTTANIRVVQTVLGHKNLGTTTIYTNPDQDYLHKVYDKAHPSQIEYFERLQAAQNETGKDIRFSQWREMVRKKDGIGNEAQEQLRSEDLVVLSHAQLEAEQGESLRHAQDTEELVAEMWDDDEVVEITESVDTVAEQDEFDTDEDGDFDLELNPDGSIKVA